MWNYIMLILKCWKTFTNLQIIIWFCSKSSFIICQRQVIIIEHIQYLILLQGQLKPEREICCFKQVESLQIAARYIFFFMCVGLVIQDFDQISSYNNHETGQYSNKTQKAQQEQSKTFKVTWINWYRQHCMTDKI